MTPYGKVIAILNTSQLLLEIDEEHVSRIVDDGELTVFGTAHSAELDRLGIPPIYAPKGTIRVVLKQPDNRFLAARYREGGQVQRRPIAALDFFTEEVRVGATWSANINQEDTLGIDFEDSIKVGDLVGMA